MKGIRTSCYCLRRANLEAGTGYREDGGVRDLSVVVEKARGRDPRNLVDFDVAECARVPPGMFPRRTVVVGGVHPRTLPREAGQSRDDHPSEGSLQAAGYV